MRVPLFIRILPAYLMVVGLFALPVWQREQANAQALESAKLAQSRLRDSKPAEVKFIEGKPAQIVLPRLGIDLPVIRGGYNIGATEWSVAGLVANYAENTAYANNKQDKTLIYGHWTPKVFGNTKNLKPGDIAYVYTENNHIFKYIFINNRSVAPTEVQVFDEFKGKPGLVLMTCDGSWAQDRRLMYFELKEAS